MKKLIFTLMVGAMAFVAPSAEAKTAGSSVSADPQIRVQIGQNRRYNRRYNNRVRTVISTRITRIGRYLYRETIRTTYIGNRRMRQQVISRVRIGRRG